MNKHYISLELDKVLKSLAKFASCEDSKTAVSLIAPESNLDLAQALIRQTLDAHTLMARFGGPSFGGL